MLIGYARVSTIDQSADMQLEALKKAGCQKVFVEQASGAKENRPELAKALDYLREGDQLVVWKLDRLARSLKQLLQTVDDLRTRKIEFLSLTDNIDTATPGGRLQFQIFGAIAEFERELARERSMAGLALARSQGRNGGRPPALDEAGIIQARALLKNGDLPAKAVAKRLGVSVSTLYKYVPARELTREKTL